MIDEPLPAPEPAQEPPRPHEGWGPIVAVLLAVGIGAGTLFFFLGAWATEQIGMASGVEWPSLVWPLINLAYGLGVWAVCAFLARRAPTPRYAAVFRMWARAGFFALACIPIHLVSASASLLAAVLQIACAGLFAYVVARQAKEQRPVQAGPNWPAALAAALVVWPWFVLGALGSWLDTLVNLAAAAALGMAFGLLFVLLLGVLQDTSDDPAANAALGGLAAGTALVVMGAAFGFTGQRLILMFLLPSLAWVVMGVAGWGRGREPATGGYAGWLLVALVAAGPLLLVDADELMLVLNLGSRDVAFHAMRALGISVLIALTLGILALALARRLAAATSWTPGRVLGVAGLLALPLALFLAGQPGWHGERLFVILNEQAILADESSIPDIEDRRAAVYAALVGQADSTQAGLRRTLDRLGVDYQPYYLVNALEVDGGPLLRLWLEARPDVDRVLSNPELRPLPAPIPPTSGDAARPDSPQWNLTMIGAPRVWETFGARGEGVVIGQADSGVDGTHLELAAQYRGSSGGALPGDDYNWFDPWNASPSPVDIGGHGTHTLGTVLGESTGVAPEATWIGCVNLARNLGNPAYYLDCMQFLFAPFPQGGDPLRDGRPDLGADVLNNSWGCPDVEGCDPEALEQAVKALRTAGVFTVASAGNDGPRCSSINAPLSLYDDVFSVGSISAAGEVSSFSSRGPVTADGSGRIKPDIAAPGEDVLSALPGGTYGLNTGTSMAGPHVAGVVALLWSAAPDLRGDIDKTEKILTATAQPVEPGSGPGCSKEGALPSNDSGHGIVDAFAAVTMAAEGQQP